MRRRTLPLQAWLVLALAGAVALPAICGVGAWLAAGRWQTARDDGRVRAAERAIAAAQLSDGASRRRLLARLESLGVEAEAAQPSRSGDFKESFVTGPALHTPGLDAAAKTVKRKPFDGAGYRQVQMQSPTTAAVLYIPRSSASTRLAVGLGAGLAGLVAVLVAAALASRRWVARPLAALAADAERIAGGELDVQPVDTRAREIAQVADALHGMAGELRKALGVSEAAERERRFLVTAIAHDLRTPLFTLRGSLEAIERGIGNGRYVVRAQEKAAHLDRLVSDLFTFSRLEYAAEATDLQPLDVTELARRAAELVEPLATERCRALELVPTAEPVIVNGDRDALLRVLTNLLDNALRHATAGVRLEVRPEPGAVVLEVSDDGPGIPEDQLEHVFAPLVRGDRARSSSTGGAGLGLAIVQHLVSAHGGEVRAANRSEGGAVLTVRLNPAHEDH